MARTNLGIQRIHSLEITVQDAGPWLSYFRGALGFQATAASGEADVEKTGMRRHLLRCADVRLILRERVRPGSEADAYLRRHPEGVSAVSFRVADVDAAEEALIERHATLIDSIRSERAGAGRWRWVSIATPLGDVEYRFIEDDDVDTGAAPGMEPCGLFDAGINLIGLAGIDHLTSNVRTLMPVLAFYEHVLGFTRYWSLQFHAEDIRPGRGTGLRSVAMRCEPPSTGEASADAVVIANNEPLRPRFNESQIQQYIQRNGGPGIQHVAFRVDDLCRAVDHCRANGLGFLTIPPAYYDALPGRIAAQGIGPLPMPLDDLRARNILLDGGKDGFLLQAFCGERSVGAQRASTGPLFIEMIQRRGAIGLGEGNFRALFEAAERGT